MNTTVLRSLRNPIVCKNPLKLFGLSNNSQESTILGKISQNYLRLLLQSSRSLSVDRNSVYDNYDKILEWAKTDPTAFWREVAESKISWLKPFTIVNDSDLSQGKIKWFSDGELNVSQNCLDRHAKDKVALIWEKDEPGQQEFVTYGELLDMTCRIANVLKEMGVQKGDTVVIYLPTSPVAAATMLACTRIGAMHCVVFAGFSATALAQRISDAHATVVVTADKSPRGGKVIELEKIVTEAVAQTTCVKKVLLWQRMGGNSEKSRDSRVIDLMKACERVEKVCEVESLNSEDGLFTLYTSGSTGKPKGLLHTNGGYLACCSWTHEVVFDVTPDDIFACVADIGWITGHSHVVYGPLSNGVTSVLFESTPLYPDPGRYWEMVQRLKINQFYTAPTAIRSLLKSGDSYPKKYDLSSLKTLGSVGEPINQEAWHWYNENIGNSRCPIMDTWWQTETGSIMIAPRPSARDAEIIPTMAMRPLPGIEVAILDPSTQEEIPFKPGVPVYGDMVVKRAWPSMARTIWKDHNRYLETYITKKHGFYLTGDEVHRTEKGYYHIIGRMDDVINVSGHRLGTSEVEDAINLHESISESAVIGVPHEVKGEVLHAFITKKDSCNKTDDQIRKEVSNIVKSEIASFAQPERIVFAAGLPRTRSGKIMRRILKKLAQGKTEELGDTSTLVDPSVVDDLIATMDIGGKGTHK